MVSFFMKTNRLFRYHHSLLLSCRGYSLCIPRHALSSTRAVLGITGQPSLGPAPSLHSPPKPFKKSVQCMDNQQTPLHNNSNNNNTPVRHWEHFLLSSPPPDSYPFTSFPDFLPTDPPPPPLFPDSSNGVAGPSATPYDDPMFWGFNDIGTSNAGDQCSDVEQNCQDLVIHGDGIQEPLDFDFDALDQFLNWEEITQEPIHQFQSGVQTEPVHCGACQLLREIIHTNEFHTTKLDVHGTDGRFHHAIVLVQSSGNGHFGDIDQQIVNFSTLDMESIKRFLIDYMQLRMQQGFALVKDSLSAFYEALCAGMNNATNTNAAPPLQYEPERDAATSSQSRQPGFINNPVTTVERPDRSSLAAQRERTSKLKIHDLAGHFHIPIADAAKDLGICSTVIKKTCRKNGLRRWPYRKIKSIEKNILRLEHGLRTQSGDEAAAIRGEIEKLRKQRTRICSGLR